MEVQDRKAQASEAQYRVAIVGSGPAGLSAAARAQAKDAAADAKAPSYVLLEGFANLSKTIYRYQKGKHVMAEPGYLRLRSDVGFDAGKREEVLGVWDDATQQQSINVRYDAEVLAIAGSKGVFELSLKSGEIVTAANVVLGIGTQGNPRKLGVPGENLPGIQYQLDDPDEYHNETILVVGAGDSAIENALALAAHNQVYILNRKSEFARAKEGNLNAILTASNDDEVSLGCYYDTVIDHIEKGNERGLLVTLATAEGEEVIDADRVIGRLGSIPPRGFLGDCGIEMNHSGPDALPVLSEHYESSVAGIYIVGALAGCPLIKGAMNQGYDVVEFIDGNMLKPADHELIEFQFAGLPFEREADELIALFMSRIPMFRQLSVLNFREMLIESGLYVALPDADSIEEANDSLAVVATTIAADPLYASAQPSTTRVVPADHQFYTEGDFGVSFYTVLDGEVVISSNTLAGGARRLGRGEFFGEMSLIAGQPRPETAAAGNNCIVLETPRRTILKLIASNEAVREGIDWVFIVRELQRHFAPTASIEELRPIADEVAQVSLKAGERLWEPGDASDSLHLVRSGTVLLFQEIEGKRTLIGERRGGELVGFMSVYNQDQRYDVAEASVATQTLEISEPLYRQLMAFDMEQEDIVDARAADELLEQSQWETRRESSEMLEFMLGDGLGEATNALIIDEYLCVGCDNCETACAETHNGISRLDRTAGNTLAHVHIPVSCRHCQQPHCMKDCPPNAIHRASNGEVFIDDSCIGCGNCQSNCPYDVIKMAQEPPPQPGLFSWMLFGLGSGPGEPDEFKVDPNKVKKAQKCDACYDVAGGPACVSACPTGAAQRVSPADFVRVIERQSERQSY